MIGGVFSTNSCLILNLVLMFLFLFISLIAFFLLLKFDVFFLHGLLSAPKSAKFRALSFVELFF